MLLGEQTLPEKKANEEASMFVLLVSFGEGSFRVFREQFYPLVPSLDCSILNKRYVDNLIVKRCLASLVSIFRENSTIFIKAPKQ